MPKELPYDSPMGIVQRLNSAYRSEVSLAEWAGMPVFVDRNVPAGEIQLRDANGVVLKVYQWPKDPDA